MASTRVYAFAVSPHRGGQDDFVPVGGQVPLSGELKTVLEESDSGAKFDTRTVIAFDVDRKTRANAMRDLVRSFAFGKPRESATAAVGIATALALAMDRRSAPALFICVCKKSDDHRRVTLWTFPRDSAFKLEQSGTDEQRVSVLRDIFSQTSGLRKAALFEGRNLKNHFLKGRALDFQANQSTREVAEFWIRRFLQCRFGLEGDAGTRLLARVLRGAYDHSPAPEAKEQLYATAVALRSAPQRQTCLMDIADNYLSDAAKQSFIEAIPDPTSANLLFEIQPKVLEETLQFRVFRLQTGVVVSSPFGEVGASVRVSDGVERELECRGRIVDEKLRTRHA
jgi:hypothetical protein